MIRYSILSFKSSLLKPHFFIGSMLRGAFGHSLKKVVCVNDTFECKSCFAQDNCLYYDFFERQNVYSQYRFDFDLDDEFLNFSLYLFDNSSDNYSYVASALFKVFTELGIGKNNILLDKNDFTMSLNSQSFYENGAFVKIKNTPLVFENRENAKKIKITFLTPLRIKDNNRLLKTKPRVELLLNSIFQRSLQLQGKPREKLNHTIEYDLVTSKTNYQNIQRYSNRQQTSMKLDGILGYMVLDNLDDTSFNLLKLGEILGIGKQCTFGLGKIKVEAI